MVKAKIGDSSPPKDSRSTFGGLSPGLTHRVMPVDLETIRIMPNPATRLFDLMNNADQGPNIKPPSPK